MKEKKKKVAVVFAINLRNLEFVIYNYNNKSYMRLNVLLFFFFRLFLLYNFIKLIVLMI